jgi:uncharacterized protein
MRSPSVSFGGHDLIPLPAGALWWPKRQALLVADLHFEKASWFARAGQFLPPYDSLETLRRLTDCVAGVDATELWCLGDSFHDSSGVARMPAEARALLDQLTTRLDWTWVTGNHDMALDSVGGHIVPEAEIDGLILRHEAVPSDLRPELSGHFHPKISVKTRGRTITRRCFLVTKTKLVLPAFGALTGGLDITDPAIQAAVGEGAAALVATDSGLLRFAVPS